MARYETAVVRLVVSGPGRFTAGLGVLVGTRQVVTCAHVVNTALGLDQREQAQPAASALVQLEFPLLAGPPTRTARVDAWVPPSQVGAGGGDVAGLVLTEDAPAGVAPARLAGMTEKPGARLRVFGYPGTPPREAGAWVDVDLKGEVEGQLIQVESRGDQTIRAQPGYSGSPVWNHGTGLVVGLLHAAPLADEEYGDAYLLPPGRVAQAWEEEFDYLLVPDNPYRGLEPFTAEHHEVFFGRDWDIDALTRRVMSQPVVVVVGPSGIGKTSLVQAGLIPKLQTHERWSVVLVRPGQDPWNRLAAGLLRVQRSTDVGMADLSKTDIQHEIERLRGEGFGPTARFLRSEGRPLLVVVDQFEELLADGQPESELLDLLLPRPEGADDACRLVHTLRADFLPMLLGVPGIASRIDQRLYVLSPPTEDQVHEAIQRAAATRGVGFQDGLVELIVRDAAGSLPLLQFTLSRLWQTQRRKTVDFTSYHAMGGVRGALDRFADHQVAKLRGVTGDVVDRMLLRLVRGAAGDVDRFTRQWVYQATLTAAEWQALRHLADARLVILDNDPAGGPYAELANEALITSWTRLNRLVRENADFLGWLAGIQQRAADGDLLPEARIAEARRWLDTRPNDIPAAVKAFVESSQTAAKARPRESRVDSHHVKSHGLRVFLCHSSSDKPDVRELYRRLRDDNFEPWLDEESLLPGQDWDHEIRKAIRACDVVLVCLSKNSISKVGYIQKEIRNVLDVADEQPDGTVFLIPVRLKPCEVPDRMRRWHWVDLFEETGYDRLIRSLRNRSTEQDSRH